MDSLTAAISNLTDARNNLRKSASDLLAAGAGDVNVQQLLGHSNTINNLTTALSRFATTLNPPAKPVATP